MNHRPEPEPTTVEEVNRLRAELEDARKPKCHYSGISVEQCKATDLCDCFGGSSQEEYIMQLESEIQSHKCVDPWTLIRAFDAELAKRGLGLEAMWNDERIVMEISERDDQKGGVFATSPYHVRYLPADVVEYMRRARKA